MDAPPTNTLASSPVWRRIVACCVVAWSCSVAWGWIVATSVMAGEPAASFPATVRVAAAHTYLRAGPGDDFYPTERLAQAATVEVWAIDDSGYCAVRPVDGSFSWLRACDVEPEPRPADAAAGGGMSVVVTDGAIARVGSQLNPLRHVTQVALEAGERVRVFERVTIDSGRHAGAWVKIEPPAGEFRWVRGADLDLPPPLAAWAVVPAPPEEAAPSSRAGLAAAGDAVAAIREAGVAVQQAVAEMNEPAPAPAASPTNPPGLLASAPLAGKLFAGWLPLGTGVFDLTAGTASPPTAVSGPATAAASADELADIDLALSLAVTGPSDSWNLAPLRERLRVAATRATSDTERTRAHAIDARLSRFEAIQGGQRALAANVAADQPPLRIGGMWSSLSALGSRPIRPGVRPGGAPAGGQPTWTPPDQVETTGRLATVVSRRPDAPRWALVDDRNNVLAFVTPQTGVNLAPLVGQQVSVRGARGYMPEYKRPYLVATEARTRIASVPTAAGTGSDATQ
jgi:hypothetical protein